MFHSKMRDFSQMWKLSYQINFAPEKYEKMKFDKRDDIYIYIEFPIVNLPILGSLSFIVCPNANGILESVISIA
jgi:hypothetical protein